MHQYLFFIGSFPIRAYGLLFMLGIVSAGITAYYIMKRDGRGWHVHIFDFTMYCGLSGIVGGLLGFANGGEFQVGGVGGIDSQIVAFRASPNETVSITKPGQMASAGAGIALSASELTLTDDGRIMAVVRAEMVQTGKAAAGRR